ncbi:MAG: hypothetical protein JWR26_4981 [Pedosphaera sp.]|nr:hypothetical protein [Pedosphaera sp.]
MKITCHSAALRRGPPEIAALRRLFWECLFFPRGAGCLHTATAWTGDCVARCLRTATVGTGMAGVRMKRWRVLRLTFGFTLLRPGRTPPAAKRALRSVCMQMCLAAQFQELRGTRPLHSIGSRAKEGRKWVISSEKGCVSFAFRRLQSASTGLGGGLIFFHGCWVVSPVGLRKRHHEEGRFDDMNTFGAKDLKDAAGCLGGRAGLADGARWAALCTKEASGKGGQGMETSFERGVRGSSIVLQRHKRAQKGTKGHKRARKGTQRHAKARIGTKRHNILRVFFFSWHAGRGNHPSRLIWPKRGVLKRTNPAYSRLIQPKT